ncbi:MAG: class I SAM-dependent methyltransferase [Chloroflexota bacterium]
MDVSICTWLLEDVLDLETSDRVALCFADDARFAYNLAESVAHVDVFDLSHGSLTTIRRQLGQVAALAVTDAVYPPAEPIYDAVLMLAPEGRDYARTLMWRAVHALKPGGSLYIAGSTREGAKAIIKDAEALFSAVTTPIYKRSHRVGRALKGETAPQAYPADWARRDGITGEPTEPQFRIDETAYGPLEVAVMPGVFGWHELDDATAFLLESVDLTALGQADAVLDMACGCGVIGALAAKHAGRVVLVDDNLLAVRCAAQTVERAALTNAEVRASDVYSALDGQRFNLILCNPPFHREFNVSTNVALRVIREAAGHLLPDGKLVIVANAFLNYEDAMGEHFRYVRVSHQDGRYKIIEGRLS